MTSIANRPRQFNVAPDKGSFPLDHKGDCLALVREYKKCLAENEELVGVCHPLAQRYLKCRMEKGLMQKEDLDNLGFDSKPAPKAADPSLTLEGRRAAYEERLKQGFLGGMRRFEEEEAERRKQLKMQQNQQQGAGKK